MVDVGGGDTNGDGDGDGDGSGADDDIDGEADNWVTWRFNEKFLRLELSMIPKLRPNAKKKKQEKRWRGCHREPKRLIAVASGFWF